MDEKTERNGATRGAVDWVEGNLRLAQGDGLRRSLSEHPAGAPMEPPAENLDRAIVAL